MNSIAFIIGGCIGLIIGIFIMRIVSMNENKGVRRNAVQGSRNNILGEVYEKVLPALPNFPYAPKDMVFIGKGCDYIIFDGLSEGRLKEIVFLELKSGKATLNANEKLIREIIEKKKIRYSEYRIQSIRGG